MDDILQEIEDIRKLLSTTKSENLRESLQKRLEELENKLEELRKEEEKKKEEKKEARKKIKLRSIRKFKIDQEKISEWFSQGKRSISGFINIMAQEIPKYFENNDEFMAYVDVHSYLALRIKFRFTKDSSPGHEVDHVFFFNQFRKREYLVQCLEDIPKIIKKQASKFEGDVADFVRKSSSLTLQGPLWVSLELIPFKPGVHKARGYIPLYDWLKNRKRIVNIQNKDDQCFWKCLYRFFYPDPHRNDHRDVPQGKLEEFMNEYKFDREIFSKGYTVPALAFFEEKYKISLNIYEIGRNGPEETQVYYNSIYNDDFDFPDVKKINLGVLREGENVHFVLIKKLQVLFGKKMKFVMYVFAKTAKFVFRLRSFFSNIIKKIIKMMKMKMRNRG
jgi:hypothetical protein